MKVETFCTILIYSLLNFMAFLLSVIFIASVENANYDDNVTAIDLLFSFFFISFFFFLVSLMIIIKHDKFDKEKLNDNIIPNTEDNKEIANPPDQEGNNKIKYNEEDEKSEKRLNNKINENKEVIYRNSDAHQIYTITNNNDNYNITVINFDEQNNNQNNPNDNNNNNENNMNLNTNNNNNEEDMQDSDKILMKILLYTFIICQLFYFAELITVTTFYGKRKRVIIYRDLVIVGYIFFGVFAILYILLIVLKFTNSARERILNLGDGGLSACCNEFIENRCNDLNNCFKTKTDEEIEISKKERVNQLEKEIEEIKTTITELEKYKKRLNEFNDKLSKLRNDDMPLTSDNIPDSELDSLYLSRIIT